jgi:DNA polymerase III epsilon subunit-like protein
MSARSLYATWAAEVLADPKTVVLDTETTGLYGYACEVAVFDGEKFLLDTLVNPQAPVEAGARKVHGITDEELSTAPVFGDVWPELVNILMTRRVIVYNAKFDSGAIRRELLRLDIDIPELGLEDHMGFEDAMVPYSDWQANMYDARYVRLNGGHRARQDCTAVFDRLREMAG